MKNPPVVIGDSGSTTGCDRTHGWTRAARGLVVRRDGGRGRAERAVFYFAFVCIPKAVIVERIPRYTGRC